MSLSARSIAFLTLKTPSTVKVVPCKVVKVSVASDLKNEALLIPSSKSASNPEPPPSTVLIAVSISAAVWSAVALVSIPFNLV